MLTVIRPLILGLILLSGFVGQGVFAQEKLHYQASYNGVLSLFQKLEIADVWYDVSEVAPSANGSRLQQVSLSVSSENFSTVEQLYPFRYQFQSFYEQSSDRTLLFEHLKITKNGKKTRHKVGLFDLENPQVQLFTSNIKQISISPEQFSELGTANSQQIIRQKLKLKPKAAALKQLKSSPIDRLTMLSMIKGQVQKKDLKRDYFVTSGDELMTYSVSWQQQEMLELGNKQVEAIKVKIEAFDLEAESKPAGGYVFADDSWNDSFVDMSLQNDSRYRHPPVYVWFSADERCLPLKFVNHHSLGEFVVELVSEV